MNFTLLTISRNCASVLNESPLYLENNSKNIRDLYDQIAGIYPLLSMDRYKLYWRYNKKTFFKIYDYITYLSALTLMVEKIVILLLENCHIFLEGVNNHSFDKSNEEEQEEDIQILVCKCCFSRDSLKTDSEITSSTTNLFKTDSEIILETITKMPEPKYFTTDLTFKMNAIECIKKGCPKLLSLEGDDYPESSKTGQSKKRKEKVRLSK
ncbi:hypothetical protein FQA39_LY14514 [Lamprigera yunnana]|nr:hypothetical protein FQA39_LY14514 [Lamprigera yunnana]